LLTADDRAEALGELSEGVYGDDDYLHDCFDVWIRDSRRLMFGVFDRGPTGSSESALVGLEVLSLFDNGLSAKKKYLT
jgi:hypothetical protein